MQRSKKTEKKIEKVQLVLFTLNMRNEIELAMVVVLVVFVITCTFLLLLPCTGFCCQPAAIRLVSLLVPLVCCSVELLSFLLEALTSVLVVGVLMFADDER